MRTRNIRERLAVNFFTAIAASACICMWGCTDVDFKWSDGRGTPLIAGFIDDSLVVAYDCREWLETTETWSIGDGYSEKSSCGHDRLLVYNYRVQEDGPRWSDSLTNKSGGYRWYQLTDSIFWRWEGNNILLWKIGETAHEMKISRKNEECSQSSKIERMHQWLDGTFIALGGNLSASNDSCQYAVLDTLSRVLIYKRLDKDLEWIQKCSDVRAWSDDVYCLVLDKEEGKSFILKNKTDSIFAPMEKLYEGRFSGNMLELGVRVCSLIKDVIICSDVKWTGNQELEFYRNDGTEIHLK